ncbi:MAG: hypothetical protein HY238_28350 [Acidobacteria bacterium]|nr:hypothetical protein [Acidobacteriota bacterium]
MMKPTRIAALFLAVVFVAGALSGYVAHTLYSQRTARAAPNPTQMRERYLTRLTRDLALSPEQVTQVSAILEQTGQRMRELRERMEPEFEAIRVAQRQRIMALLTPEQQPKYEKVLEEQRKRHEREGRSGGRPH